MQTDHDNLNSISRRQFVQKTAALGTAAAASLGGIRAAYAAPVELRYFYRAPWPSSEIYANWMIEEWNKKEGARIHVTGASVDGETYKTKLTIELSSSSPPDLYYSWEGGRGAELVINGFSADLDPYYAKYGWDKTLTPAGVKLAQIAGHKHFVPTEMCASVVWYRPDIYEKLGLTVPKTWDQLLANAAKAKSAGMAGFMLANQKKWPSQFMWSAILVNKHGLDTYDAVIANKIAWTDSRLVDTTAVMKKLADDKMFEPSFNSIDVGPAMVPWSQGKGLHWYQGSFNLGRFRGEKPQCCVVPMDWFPMPAFGDRKPVMSVFAEDTIMIHAKSPNKDAAAEFLNWMVSKEAMSKKLEIDKPFPSNVAADLSRLSAMEQRLGKAMGDAGSFTFMHVDHAVSPAISDKFLDGLQGVLAGAMSPQQAMQLTETEAVRVRGKV
jgi:raffinose/stachyose/melibiose transport system substrate-binding protein